MKNRQTRNKSLPDVVMDDDANRVGRTGIEVGGSAAEGVFYLYATGPLFINDAKGNAVIDLQTCGQVAVPMSREHMQFTIDLIRTHASENGIALN